MYYCHTDIYKVDQSLNQMTNQETKQIKDEMKDEKSEKSVRGKGRGYPLMTLDSSLEVAKIVDEVKRAARSDIEKGLGKKGGGLTKRISAARQWSLIQGVGEMRVTDIGMDILHPEKDEDTTKAKRQAYFDIPLFRELYDEYGWELPRKDLLVNKLVRTGIKHNEALTIVNIIFHSRDTIFNNESILEIEEAPRDKNIVHSSKKIFRSSEELRKAVKGGERLTEKNFNLILTFGSLRERIKNFEKPDIEDMLNTLENLVEDYPLIKSQIEILKSDISLLDVEVAKKIMPQRIEALIKMVMHDLGVIL